MLSLRLLKVAELIVDVETVIDIGTDHGYLPIYLVKNQKCKTAYALDISNEPLMGATKNILKEKLENEIKTLRSDGFEIIFKNKINFDCATICGLGTSTILQIIKQVSNQKFKLIICSNTEISLIRQFAIESNWNIEFEDFIEDNKKFYWIIKLNLNKPNFTSIIDTKFGEKFFYINNKEYIKYLKAEIIKFKKILEKLDFEKHKKNFNKIQKEIIQKEKFINEITKNN